VVVRGSLRVAGAALVGALALVAAGCGGEEPADPAARPAQYCFDETLPLIDALRKLANELFYEEGVWVDYDKRLAALKEARAETPLTELSPACKQQVVALATKAIGNYEDAYERWQACGRKRGGCDYPTIEKKLQAIWYEANELRMQAEGNLDKLQIAEAEQIGFTNG
jgi:hypothetical protein